MQGSTNLQSSYPSVAKMISGLGQSGISNVSNTTNVFKDPKQ
jgi:hypothetical protein